MDVSTMKKDLENQIGSINKDLENIYLPHEAVLILLGKRTAFKIALELIDSIKQEQKPVQDTEDMPYITDEHFFEREPADSFKYKLAEYMTKCCTKKEGPYGYTYGISAESILKMAEEELIKRGVVQKPAEWSEEDKQKLNRIYSIIGWAMDEHAFSSCKKLIGDKEGVELQDFLRSIANPNQEWSDEDESFLDSIEEAISSYYDLNHAPQYHYWLEEKLKGLRSYPKQEWSEEDEDMVKMILGDLEWERRNTVVDKDIRLYDEKIAWLKSLRPQPKSEWNEDVIRQTAIHFLGLKSKK